MRQAALLSTGNSATRCALQLALLVFAARAISIAAPTATELTQAIRDASLDPAACYRVRDVSYSKNGIRLYFNEGYLIFSKPVMGQRLVAAFSSEVEGGDGEILLIPPTSSERQSLASFTQSPTLDEHLRAALLVFTDGSGSGLLDELEKGEGGKPAPEVGAMLAGQWNQVVANVTRPLEMRLIEDLLGGQPAEKGMTLIAASGKNLGAFEVIYDGRADHHITVRQLVTRAGQERFDIWTRFAPRRTQPVKPIEPEVAPMRYEIHAEIGTDLVVKATTKLSVRIGRNPVRAIPFDIATVVKTDVVRLDGAPADLLRDAISQRGRLSINARETRVLIVAPELLDPGSEHVIEIEHAGKVATTRGDGVYFVEARGSWYPRFGVGLATYDVTFRYPKRLTLVTAGEVVEDRSEGEWRTTRRRTASLIGSVGFNLGVYEKISGNAGGVAFEVYGNRNLVDSLRPRVQVELPIAMPPNIRPGQRFPTRPLELPIPPAPPDPLARLRVVADDLSSSLEYFRGILGPPVLNTLTVAPIPGTFGQGFPGLVYLSTFAYLAPNERPMALREAREQVFFSDLLVPHETAHQWWGGITMAAGSEDEWLLESLANYSALLWLEKRKGPRAVMQVLDGYRQELLSRDNEGRVVESIGPIVWGDRLDGASYTNSWRAITYGKGTWILHMLRKRMGDAAFLKLLGEIPKRFRAQPLSTDAFATLARELRPSGLSADAVDTFFDNWVYGTGIPALKLRTTVKGLQLTGTLQQTDVSEDFTIDVPIEVQYAKGVPGVIWMRASSEVRNFTVNLKQIPGKITIADDILARDK